MHACGPPPPSDRPRLSRDLPDIRDFAVWGILAAPVCKPFAGSGAKHPRSDAELLESLHIVSAVLRIVWATRQTLRWWALENPSGKLPKFLGDHRHTFNPNDYGDPYSKRTCLWGDFTIPQKRPVPISHAPGRSPIFLASPGPDRWRLRSKTPPGFARAFFEANP